jgi:hypothetical protein
MSQAPQPFEPPKVPNADPSTNPAPNSTYNVVTDLVTGVNVRGSDNKFQAIFIGLSVLPLALIASINVALNPSWNMPWYGGAMLGAVAGLIFGLFASGIVLMIYRAMRHLRGKHD